MSTGMNKLLNSLQTQATYNIMGVPQVDQKQFAALIVRHVIDRMEAETQLAVNQNEHWTASVLAALQFEILEDFDMELHDE